MKQGIFYAVGVGAGDPMDMTLRAKAVLEQADIIVTPIPKAGGTSAAYAIAAQAADLSYAERLDILFPMQAHNDYRERLRSGVLQPVCTALDSGRQVAMVLDNSKKSDWSKALASPALRVRSCGAFSVMTSCTKYSSSGQA